VAATPTTTPTTIPRDASGGYPHEALFFEPKGQKKVKKKVNTAVSKLTSRPKKLNNDLILLVHVSLTSFFRI
jgi:hypothetical protein